MALYRSPLTVTLWPASFLKKYGPMIPPAHKAHQTGRVVVYRASTTQVLGFNNGWARSTLPFIPATLAR
ncbi:hypothetical protein TNCV_2960061 [Trichonephila clavipes]|nr:hypothetical protein TNCV_2960061 [Trichonephila clavipes]